VRQAKLGISYRLKSDIGKAEQAAYHQKRIDGGNEIDEAGNDRGAKGLALICKGEEKRRPIAELEGLCRRN